MIDRSDHISRKIGLYCVYGYFLATTFSHALAQNLFGAAIIAAIVLFFKEDHKFGDFRLDFFKISIFSFIIWSLISALAGPTPNQSVFMLKEEWLFLLIPVAGFLVRSKREVLTAVSLFAGACAIVGLYAIWQHYGGMDLYRNAPLTTGPPPSELFRVIGFFSHRLTCGNYFAIAGLTILGLAFGSANIKLKIMYCLSLVISSITVAFTYSRGPLAVLVVGTFLFAITLRKKLAIAVVGALAVSLAVIALFSPDLISRFESSFQKELKGEHGATRLSVFRTSARMIEEHPLFGVGPGNFGNNYETYRDDNSKRRYNHAHNDFLNVAAYSGIPGGVFFIAIWIAILIKLIKSLGYCARNGIPSFLPKAVLMTTVGFMMTSMYEATFADEEVRMLLMAMWGLFIAWEQIVKRDRKSVETIEKA